MARWNWLLKRLLRQSRGLCYKVCFNSGISLDILILPVVYNKQSYIVDISVWKLCKKTSSTIDPPTGIEPTPLGSHPEWSATTSYWMINVCTYEKWKNLSTRTFVTRCSSRNCNQFSNPSKLLIFPSNSSGKSSRFPMQWRTKWEQQTERKISQQSLSVIKMK